MADPVRANGAPPGGQVRQTPPQGGTPQPPQFPPDVINRAAILGMPPEAVAKDAAAADKQWKALYGGDSNNSLQAVVERYSKQAEGLPPAFRISAGNPPNLGQLREQALAKLSDPSLGVDVAALRDRPLAEILGILAQKAKPVEAPPPRAADAPPAGPPGAVPPPPPGGGRSAVAPPAARTTDPEMRAILAQNGPKLLDAVREAWKKRAAQGPDAQRAFMDALVQQRMSEDQLQALARPGDKPGDPEMTKAFLEAYERAHNPE